MRPDSDSRTSIRSKPSAPSPEARVGRWTLRGAGTAIQPLKRRESARKARAAARETVMLMSESLSFLILLAIFRTKNPRTKEPRTKGALMPVNGVKQLDLIWPGGEYIPLAFWGGSTASGASPTDPGVPKLTCRRLGAPAPDSVRAPRPQVGARGPGGGEHTAALGQRGVPGRAGAPGSGATGGPTAW